MLLWIAMAVLTAAASLTVLIPLGRPRHGSSAHAGAARSIYRDQLVELARDRERGLIGESEAEAARIEISRRLLNSDAGPDVDAPRPMSAYRIERLVAVVAIPLIAIGTYLYVGAPQFADRPSADRANEQSAQGDIGGLIAKVEAHLAANPEDGRGWEILSPIYTRLGRFDDAVRALGNAKRLLGSSAERESLYGEALTRASGDVVTAEARAAFEKALKFDPEDVRSRFYLAFSLGQSGRKEEAIAAWNALIASAPAEAQWLPAAQAELARLQPTTTVPDPAPAPVAPGPTEADVAAAAAQTPAERQQMIEGMVAGLAAKLDDEPADAQGWERLFRAYMVLGQPDQASAALDRARGKLVEQPELLAVVEKAAHDIGIGRNGS